MRKNAYHNIGESVPYNDRLIPGCLCDLLKVRIRKECWL